jgi:hypothetical protein
MALASTAIIDKAETLALKILEIERRTTVPNDNTARFNASITEMLGPPLQLIGTADTKARLGNGMGAARFWPNRPIEKSNVGTGRGLPIGVEQVIGTHIVLIDGLLHKPQTERTGIEAVIVDGARRHGREVVNSFEIHDALPPDRNCWRGHGTLMSFRQWVHVGLCSKAN